MLSRRIGTRVMPAGVLAGGSEFVTAARNGANKFYGGSIAPQVAWLVARLWARRLGWRHARDLVRQGRWWQRAGRVVGVLVVSVVVVGAAIVVRTTGEPSRGPTSDGIRVSPLYTVLTPGANETVQLVVSVRDPSGDFRPVSGDRLRFASYSPAVASVDGSGLVRIHPPTVLDLRPDDRQRTREDAPRFDATAVIRAGWNDTWAAVPAVIRRLSRPLALDYRDYPGRFVALHLPASIEEIDVDRMVRRFEVVRAVDLGYRALEAWTGTDPDRGAIQHFVLDVVEDEWTSAGGLAFNPVRLTWVIGRHGLGSGLLEPRPSGAEPNWGTMFHELAHNFTLTSPVFAAFCKRAPALGDQLLEATATLGEWWALEVIHDRGEIGSAARESLTRRLAADLEWARHPFDAANHHHWHPGMRERAHAFLGLMIAVRDESGIAPWFALGSTFVPEGGELPPSVRTDLDLSTWIVASLATSLGDARARALADAHGFAVNPVTWDAIRADVERRVRRRRLEDALGLLDQPRLGRAAASAPTERRAIGGDAVKGDSR